eukprot:403330852
MKDQQISASQNGIGINRALSAKLQPDFLSNFLANLIKMQDKKPVEGFMPRNEFMKTISLELFNLNVDIAYNDVFAVATFGQKRNEYQVQEVTTRYLFAQFWCEFTKEVLTEFLEEDIIFKQQELTSFSVKNINESSILPSGELNKRNFYLQLFRTYCELPFEETLKNFLQVYTDVFFKEKPLTVQKYFLCEVAIIETVAYQQDIKLIYAFNFAHDTSRELYYHQSAEVQALMRKAVKMVKKSDMGVYEQPYKKKDNKQNNSSIKEELQNGLEFFFSNVMMKCYQVPVLFTQSSEEPLINDQIGTYIVMFFEKSVRKRTYAKTQTQKQRLRKNQDLKKNFDSSRGRVLEDSLYHRESKMRRFCNYFVTLFHQKKLNPFSQFVNGQTLKVIKQKVRDKMNQFTEDDQQDDGEGSTPNKLQNNMESAGQLQSLSSRSKKQSAEIQKPHQALQKQSIQEDLNCQSVPGITGSQTGGQHYQNKKNRKMRKSSNSSFSGSQMSAPREGPYSKNRLYQNRQSMHVQMNSQKNYDNFISDDNGLIKNNPITKSNNGRLSEMNIHPNIQDLENDKRAQKSKSVLSRYMSSRQDKYSIDFDDIQPQKVGGITGNFLHSKQQSKHDFYDYSDMKSIKGHGQQPISRISSYASDELNYDPYEEAKDPKKVKAYNGKKIKSRQTEIKQDSTKFQTAQFGQATIISPKIQVGPPTLANDDIKAVQDPYNNRMLHDNNGRARQNSKQRKGGNGNIIGGGFDIISDMNEVALNNIKDNVKYEAQQDYYAHSYKNSIGSRGLDKGNAGYNADSMLSLYNKIPDSKNINFHGSEVSQEFQQSQHHKRPSKASDLRLNPKMLGNVDVNDKANTDKLYLDTSPTQSNPYLDTNQQQQPRGSTKNKQKQQQLPEQKQQKQIQMQQRQDITQKQSQQTTLGQQQRRKQQQQNIQSEEKEYEEQDANDSEYDDASELDDDYAPQQEQQQPRNQKKQQSFNIMQ